MDSNISAISGSEKPLALNLAIQFSSLASAGSTNRLCMEAKADTTSKNNAAPESFDRAIISICARRHKWAISVDPPLSPDPHCVRSAADAKGAFKGCRYSRPKILAIKSATMISL
eukprot:236663-Karenia_brevis.AAC.1